MSDSPSAPDPLDQPDRFGLRGAPELRQARRLPFGVGSVWLLFGGYALLTGLLALWTSPAAWVSGERGLIVLGLLVTAWGIRQAWQARFQDTASSRLLAAPGALPLALGFAVSRLGSGNPLWLGIVLGVLAWQWYRARRTP